MVVHQNAKKNTVQKKKFYWQEPLLNPQSHSFRVASIHLHIKTGNLYFLSSFWDGGLGRNYLLLMSGSKELISGPG